MKYEDISLLIQGPIVPGKLDSFDYIDHYKNIFGEIILSTYTEHLSEELIKFCQDNNIKLVDQTINFHILERKFIQIYCVLLGLKNVTKKYCVKHRIDEKYNNIQKLISKFLENDEKKVSGSMYFNPKNRERFCSSDHLYVAKTDKLLKAVELTFNNAINGIVDGNSYCGESSTEITLTKNFIRASGFEPTQENHDEVMKNYFDIVFEGEMEPFTIRQNGGDHVFHTEEQFCKQHPKLNNIDDIFVYCDWWDKH